MKTETKIYRSANNAKITQSKNKQLAASITGAGREAILAAKPAHTPGPWTLQPFKKRNGEVVAYSVESETRSPIAGITLAGERKYYVTGDYGHVNQHSEDTANARLIAAAPDLLAACKALRIAFAAAVPPSKMMEAWRPAWNGARAAIAKAEGSL